MHIHPADCRHDAGAGGGGGFTRASRRAPAALARSPSSAAAAHLWIDSAGRRRARFNTEPGRDRNCHRLARHAALRTPPSIRPEDDSSVFILLTLSLGDSLSLPFRPFSPSFRFPLEVGPSLRQGRI